MERGKYLGDAVYGALDGIVTTFAVVAGVVGASLSSKIILILGFANLLADGISMAAGSYLSRRSIEGFRDQQRSDELERIESNPEKQRRAIRRIYREKGFTGRFLEQAVKTITGDKRRWTEEMMVGDLGLLDEGVNPALAGITTFVAFFLAGSVPLLSYVAALFLPQFSESSFLLACFLTGLTLFIVGSMRSLLMLRNWLHAGLEMLVVGGIAAGASYVFGYVLKGLLG